MATTYTVQKGDCLWGIAAKHLGSGLKWTYLADINRINRNKPIIYPNQVLKLSDGTTAPTVDSTSNTVPIIQFLAVQSGSDRTMFVTWTWTRKNTYDYQVKWYYDTGDGVWFVGNDSNTEEQQSIYNAPSNAKRVYVKIKPYSETYTVNNEEVEYWKAGWSTAKTYTFAEDPPEKPSTPTVTIEKFKLTATLDNVNDEHTTKIEFQVVKDNKTIFSTGTATLTTNSASYSCNVDAGGEYKVRCRGGKNSVYGEWSDYSSSVSTIPTTPTKINTCRANSETSVYLAWTNVSTAKSYEIEYATKKEYFDRTSNTTTINNIQYPYWEVTGLESGRSYFFRVRSINDQGESGWTSVVSTVIGEPPAAPTTWSSTTTAIVGEELVLYWVHNSEDSSKQTYAEVEITANGKKNTYTVNTTSTAADEDEEEKTYSYKVNTTTYSQGTKISWRVRTAGVTKTYGEWSISRVVDIYTPPTLTLTITDNSNNAISTLKSFPFKIKASAGPNTQTPIGYSVSIKANSTYETIDNIGNTKIISKGDEVYSKYFDINRMLEVAIKASDVDLENNISYTITCIVSMNSGLTTTATKTITVGWSESNTYPNATIAYFPQSYSTSIKPYTVDKNNSLVSGVTLSVYRREYDGSFTEIATGIKNNNKTFVTDPHPSLDYARYRVVAISDSTGHIDYYDIPGYPIKEKGIVIQWNDKWVDFDTDNSDAIDTPSWSGSLLYLPYNIDVSDSNDKDVSLVNYIGRSNPVSYYGTQLGVKSTWNTLIPKSDKETLYQLRRLSIWQGDVYVREPSGSGYWANISVSFSQTHNELTIPITFDITRVEGGM